jgi:hypothetical protein
MNHRASGYWKRLRSIRLTGPLRSTAAGVLLLLASCSALRRPGPVVDTSHDPRIQQEVEARLALEPAVAVERMRVVVRGGVVSLYGTVQGMGALNCAIATAQLVEGVRTVVDQMELEPGPRAVTCLMPART